jgi:lipoprotein-releasing system ATP-binding protein
MNDPVMVLSNISKSYYHGTDRELTVLKEVNLSIQPGEIVALVAPSGEGKSTLLHIAGLLDRPDSGDIIISGDKVQGKPDYFRTNIRKTEIGFVYQSHNLLPEFSALENVILPQLVNGKSKKDASSRANLLLERVGVGHRNHHRPGILSGGEQQRVAFCRALANKPRLILADEPTGNLDIETSRSVFGTLVDLATETGLSAIVATHNMELAALMNRIVYLKKGKIN